MSDKWNGESRGIGDVMITRIRNLMREKGVSGKIINESTLMYNEERFDSDVAWVIATLEENNLELTDVLERVYLKLKEKPDEIR